MNCPQISILRRLAAALALASSAATLSAAVPATGPVPPAPVDLPPGTPYLPYLSPQESLATMSLPPGYHLELVVSEPIIREPVVTVFDGNGRMYVAEMRSYMQDANASNEKAAISRVSLHWSSKGDGVYDKHTVFADNMVLPRMILPLKDSVLIQETFTGDVYEYRDTNGDGVADEKKPFHKFDVPRDNNMEHQPSGLVWSLDNWIYSTYNAVRIRWTPQGAISEPTASNGGQWGLTQDNYGKTWVTNAGSDRGPLNFQQPIVYGAFQMPNEEAANYREVYPLVGLSDVQAGARYARPEDGTVNRTTSAAGIDIYRGDRLPADLVGDLLYGEPVGRLIRRTKIEVRDGITYLRNAYEKSEFIRSTDVYFRPVNLVTAPDGTIYITDMYRGIIQQGNWTRPGSFLRGKIDQYGLADKINGGRVWRLVHDSMKPGPQPRMLEETPAQLVAHLSHPNGWWRDTAQKLIIVSQDKSVVPALQALARTSTNPLARIHALWTLEGLDALDAPLVREKLKDADIHVHTAAIRASETLYKKGDTSLGADIVNETKDNNAEVAIQALLTAKLLKLPEAQPLIAEASTGSPSAGVKELATRVLSSFGSAFGPQFTAAQRTQLVRGQTIYLQLCFACHGLDGKGAPGGSPGVTLAPPLSGSPTVTGHRDAIIMTLLHGLGGPVGGKTYDGQMMPMGGNEDDWIAAVTSYVRASFGNEASLITAQDVASVRAANTGRTTPWTIPELTARLPQPLANREAWKFTTNRVTTATEGGADVNGPTKLSFTAAPPVAGAWLQVELPEVVTLSDMRLSSDKSPTNYTRAYKVELSTDGHTWGEAAATGQGTGALVDISFKPTSVKFVRITHTAAPAAGGPGRGGRGGAGPGGRGPGFPGRGGNQAPANWTVDDVQLFQPAPTLESAK